jgi:uncharacterized protein YjbJ (UPF0337 family)
MNQQILDGNWNEITGKIREKWGQLTDDDFQQIRGDAEQLVGIIQRKTGEAREAIEQHLQEISGSAASAVGTARDYAHHASDQVCAGYAKADRFVRDRPVQSLLVFFGVGLIAGVVAALSLRSR